MKQESGKLSGEMLREYLEKRKATNPERYEKIDANLPREALVKAITKAEGKRRIVIAGKWEFATIAVIAAFVLLSPWLCGEKSAEKLDTTKSASSVPDPHQNQNAY